MDLKKGLFIFVVYKQLWTALSCMAMIFILLIQKCLLWDTASSWIRTGKFMLIALNLSSWDHKRYVLLLILKDLGCARVDVISFIFYIIFWITNKIYPLVSWGYYESKTRRSTQIVFWAQKKGQMDSLSENEGKKPIQLVNTNLQPRLLCAVKVYTYP